MLQEIVWLIEQTVSKSCSQEDAEEAIEEEGVELLLFKFLLAIESQHNIIGCGKTNSPKQGIPSQSNGAEL